MSCDQFCRGCLSADRTMTKAILYKPQFKALTGITISPKDGLPQWLCYKCVALLQKCIKFRDKVLKSHYTLRRYVLESVPTKDVNKDAVVKDIDLSVSVKVESLKVEDETIILESEDKVTVEECCENIPSPDVTKASSCPTAGLNTVNLCSVTRTHKELTDQGKIKENLSPVVGDLNLESVEDKNESPNPDDDDNIITEEVIVEEQIEFSSESSTDKSEYKEPTEEKKVEENYILDVEDIISKTVKIKDEDCDNDITIEELSIEEQIALRSKSLSRKASHTDKKELKKVQKNISLGVSELNSEVVEIKDESDDDDDISIEELSLEEQFELRRKSLRRKPEHRKHTELAKLSHRAVRRNATVSRRARERIDEDTDEEVDVVSLDDLQPIRKDSVRLRSHRARRRVHQPIETAIPRKRLVPLPNLATTANRPTRSNHRRHVTRIDSDSDSEDLEVARRFLHNDVERKRRTSLKYLFNELKRQVPATRYNKHRSSKAMILREATALCRKFSQEDFEREKLKMKQDKLMMTLKKLRGI